MRAYIIQNICFYESKPCAYLMHCLYCKNTLRRQSQCEVNTGLENLEIWPGCLGRGVVAVYKKGCKNLMWQQPEAKGVQMRCEILSRMKTKHRVRVSMPADQQGGSWNNHVRRQDDWGLHKELSRVLGKEDPTGSMIADHAEADCPGHSQVLRKGKSYLGHEQKLFLECIELFPRGIMTVEWKI